MKLHIGIGGMALNGGHIKCLLFIRRAAHCTANDIVRKTGRDKAQIARLLKDMEQKGWIEKRANPADKRSGLLLLTDEGLRLVSQIHQVETKVVKQMCKHIPDNEQEIFINVMDKMIKNLQESH